MPDLKPPRRSSSHSLLTSLGVSFVLIVGYVLFLQAFSTTSMAEGAIENGEDVVVTRLRVSGDDVIVTLPDSGADTLNYVSDPDDYHAPLTVRVWVQNDGTFGRPGQVVVAKQDLERLTGSTRKQYLGVAVGVLVTGFVCATVYLNWPRRRDPDPS